MKPVIKTFERTYGWHGILNWAEEIHTWNDPLSRIVSEDNLNP